MATNYVFEPKINYLEMAHTYVYSYIRITPYQPLIWTKNNKSMFSNISKIFVPQSFPNLYFKICSYTQKITLDLINTLKTTIYNTKFTKNTQIHFQLSIHLFFFQKYISVGLPGPLHIAFELKNWLAYVKNTPDATTLTLHGRNSLKKTRTSKYVFDIFQIFIFCIILYMLRATQPD